MLLAVKKEFTTRVHIGVSKRTKKPGIFRMADDGTISEENLKGPSYCRLCHSVANDYSDAVHHMSEFGCMMVIQEHAIDCPHCKSGNNFTSFNDFYHHFLEQHDDDFRNSIKLDVTNLQLMWHKIYTLIWMIEIFKATLDIWGEDTKPFLPNISYRMKENKRNNLDCGLCPWPICVMATTGFRHEHKVETNPINGRCTFCNNYHHFSSRSLIYRICTREPSRGILPT